MNLNRDVIWSTSYFKDNFGWILRVKEHEKRTPEIKR